jgi:hypothetical protein
MILVLLGNAEYYLNVLECYRWPPPVLYCGDAFRRSLVHSLVVYLWFCILYVRLGCPLLVFWLGSC